ncbi:MAG: GNAT family N-acetyltransferase [Clostridia bacterium]|nr:GNAT family N-acetyltransferase [Clostridia bacterium]
MHLERFDDPAAFYRAAGDYLLEHEAHHNLILGVTFALMDQPERGDAAPYLAVVREGGRVVGAALRTPPRKLVLSLMSDEAAAEIIARDTLTADPRLPGVLGPKADSLAFARAWTRLSGQSHRLGMAQRIYALEDVPDVPEVPGELRHAAPEDGDLLVAWVAAFNAEALGEGKDEGGAARVVDSFLRGCHRDLVIWWDGQPVSMAGYGGRTPNGIRVSAVYTPPDLRRRGYATACVAALSRYLLASGYRRCFLFTDLSNPTSNRIYKTIGYRPVCDVDEYRFAS